MDQDLYQFISNKSAIIKQVIDDLKMVLDP
jgi:hypothetical protein